MVSREDKIRQLEQRLSDLRMTASYGNNCDAIARLELQLFQLYHQTGNKMLADQAINEALRALQDPLCPKTRTTQSMINNIEYYKSHPQMLNAQSVPAIYRYLSIIVLIGGYAVLYAIYYGYKQYFSYNDFLIGILIIFMLSFGLNFFVRSAYTRRASRN